MKTDVKIDCFGLFCPLPIIEVAKKIKEMKVGEVLELVSTDKGIKEDMPAWCKSTGHELVGIEESDGEYKVYIKKTTR